MTGPDPDVVASLIDNHRAFLSFLQRRVGSRELAEDLLQEAFARGLDRIDTLRDDESAVAWFYRALRNAVIDHHRRTGARDRALDRFAAELDPATVHPALHAEACRCVLALAQTLRPEHADAIRRVDLDGVAVKDFAAERGLTRSNAGVRLHRARRALREQVAASCGTCADHGCLDCACGGPAAQPGSGSSSGSAV